ncbi:MAG: UDP-N-acetylglucosamine--N-acetylmuramyl-(pentapeptide) pyrophosphoryl-undecaprenol N-acetylglucosamine transferase, partial [Planctomycetota bacterium]|nr:UDP-N-acetylglucosamine--N-acetylmuramyl-(pentapeptide) pyrophosphoryl-undecaprenol N-acetylglucosamine transferase [Planctomycetota bacterium]
LGEHAGVRVTGPLLRAGACATRRDPAHFGLRPDRRTLLVTGGSLGSERLYERFLDGLEAALAADPARAERIQILHATGATGLDPAARYAALGLTHAVVPFIHDMGAAYGSADLVLCRAGASTCAELLATRTPAVLVPYPHHADRQQFENAAPLVAAGGAVVVEQEALTPAGVAREVLDRLEDPAALAAMRAGLSANSTDASGETADDLIRFLGWAR